MGVVLVSKSITQENLQIASKDHGDYIKVVIDIVTGDMTIGGEWHAEGEKVLLEKGSKQENLWGGGIDIKMRSTDTTSLINIRPVQNNPSMEILDSKIRDTFTKILKQKFQI